MQQLVQASAAPHSARAGSRVVTGAMKVCVFGAGAIGGHLAARLHRGGAQASIVARGPNLQALRARGRRVTAADGVIEAPVQASGDPAELGPQDAVIVTVKAPACQRWRPRSARCSAPTRRWSSP